MDNKKESLKALWITKKYLPMFLEESPSYTTLETSNNPKFELWFNEMLFLCQSSEDSKQRFY